MTSRRGRRHGSRGVSTTLPPVAVRNAARNASFAPRTRYSAAVSDQPDRATEGTRARSCLRDPHGVRARVDLAKGCLVHARGHLHEPDLGRLEVGPDDDRARVVEIPWRSVGLDRLDVDGGLAPGRSNTASMPPVSSPGNVHDTSWLKKREKPSQPTQSRAQRPVESEVQATDRPRPYCHCARSGSSRAVTRTVCAAALAVVPL